MHHPAVCRAALLAPLLLLGCTIDLSADAPAEEAGIAEDANALAAANEAGGATGGACTHTFGGVYADGGCSAAYQCCGGQWRPGTGSCGECACTDATGAAGCEPEPEPDCVEREEEGASCTHTFGGAYGHRACSASYQCCDGQWRQGTGSCGECACVEPSGETGCELAPEPGCEAPSEPPSEPPFEATFVGSHRPLPESVRTLMTGSSWRPGCPVGLDQLALLEMTHWGFDGDVYDGEMVVAAYAADDVLEAFRQIFEAGFPIERMRLVDYYEASDDLSMADNNTSAFNCRLIGNTGIHSQHSYGTAIDINPLQNPYVSGSVIDPPTGAAYVDRSLEETGMIKAPGPVTSAFSSIGWYWGGNWSSLKDYQHFSESGG